MLTSNYNERLMKRTLKPAFGKRMKSLFAFLMVGSGVFLSIFPSQGQDCYAVVPDCVDTESGCYAWVLATEPFCCLVVWDGACEELYNHCSTTCTDPDGGGGLCEGLMQGCTYPEACNFNPNANCPDGSCQMPGCLDPGACNYAPFATCQGNFTCAYYESCHNPYACNFDEGGCSVWQVCTYPGCTNPDAVNYNESAGCDEGSCLLVNCDSTEAFSWNYCYSDNANSVVAHFAPVPGQEVTVHFVSGSVFSGDEITIQSSGTILFQGSGALTGQAFTSTNESITVAIVSDAFLSCSAGYTPPLVVNVYCLENEQDFGCYDPSACNFNPSAPYSGALCLYPGCTNPGAQNYNPEAGCDDDSCLILGCNVPTACNFNPEATVLEPGSCEFASCICPADLNGDGYVNFPDLVAMLGMSGCTEACAADFNGNGLVDFSDILFLVQAFGGICN